MVLLRGPLIIQSTPGLENSILVTFTKDKALLQPKSGIEIRIVRLKQGEWDRVQRVGYIYSRELMKSILFSHIS